MRQRIAIGIATTLAMLAGQAALAEWTVDNAHSAVNFSVKHFFTPVTGSFGDFDIDLEYDAENPEGSRVSATIDVASIDTGNERRDNHLRSADFFDTETHPQMTFESSSVRPTGDSELVATGVLTIKGVSKEIELPITLLGVKEIPEEMQQRFGQAIAGFSAETEIDRGDFEVGVGNFAATLVVGGQVSIEILVEAGR